MYSKASAKFSFLLLLVFIWLMVPSVFAADGDKFGDLSQIINTPAYDVRVDIADVVGPVKGTVTSEEDTVAVQIGFYGSDTDLETGLDYYEFFNVVYFDTTELEYVDVQGLNWETDSIEVDIEVYNGDTVKLEIHGYGDLLEPGYQSWMDVYQLRFFIKCHEEDELTFGLDIPDIGSENWTKVSGSSSLEEYDDIAGGTVSIQAYWAGCHIDTTTTLLGEDTVLVDVYLDSINYNFWLFKNYLRYDTANYEFIGAVEGEIDFLYVLHNDMYDSVHVYGFHMSEDFGPYDSSKLMYTLKFLSKATDDTLVSPITFDDQADSNMFYPRYCSEIWDDVEIEFQDGGIVVPNYLFYADLEFVDNGGPGDTVSLAIKTKNNFPAGLYPTGNIQFLIDHDPALDYLGLFGNVYDSVEINVTPINDTLLGVNLNMPNGTPGYLPPTEDYITYCELEMRIDPNATCPSEYEAEFRSSYGYLYGTTVTDITGNVPCDMVNEKLIPAGDVLNLLCADVWVNSASGTSYANQTVYIGHQFELDSVYIELRYDRRYFCYMSDYNAIPGIDVTNLNDSTLKIYGGDLALEPHSTDPIVTIRWGARRSGYRTMTVDVQNSEILDTYHTSVYLEETDNTVSTNLPLHQVSLCPLDPIEKPDEEEEVLPTRFALHQNRPNPFNPTTLISFDLPQASTVSLEIHNILGQKVETLIDNAYLNPGQHQVEWNSGRRGHSSGVYFYILRAGDFVETRKMMLIK